MIQPREFPNLAASPYLTGKLVSDHLALYRKQVDEWEAIRQRRGRVLVGGRLGMDALSPEQRFLLTQQVASLQLLPVEGPLHDATAQLAEELNARGITFYPDLVPGEDEFFVRTGTTAINVPWYMCKPDLWELVNSRHLNYTVEELVRVLRHEAGHALGYAFEVYKRAGWQRAFGDFEAPYQQAYEPDPRSTDHVAHLHRSGPWQNSHYAQKHPDEDWAETFAVWLTPGLDWRAQYAEGTGARLKLEYVDDLINRDGALYGNPPVRGRGPVSDWRSLEYTVGEFLDVEEGGSWSEHLALARREPEVRAGVVLHELYFEQFAEIPTERGSVLNLFAINAFGSTQAWATDLRALCMGADEGWALVVADRRSSSLRNTLVRGNADGVPPGAEVIIAIDLWEHAYAPDYGLRRDAYLAAVWRAMDWNLVEARLGQAMRAWRP